MNYLEKLKTYLSNDSPKTGEMQGDNLDGSIAGISTTNGNGTSAKSAVSEKWAARNLDRNSIKDTSYTVQKGDTLWEVAEAKYGSGFEWNKILSANKDKVGFLPNGNQALIE